MLALLTSWWHKLAPRTKIIVVSVFVGVLAILYLLASLHQYKELAEKLKLRINELQAKYKIEVLNGDIRAAEARSEVRQEHINDLTDDITKAREKLEKQYQSQGMTADEIVNSFNRLGL